MSGQHSAAARFLRDAVAEIAGRVIADTEFGMISDRDHPLVAHKVKKWVKQHGGMRQVMMILWGTQLDPYSLFEGDFASDSQDWLTTWGVRNEHRSDADRRLMYHIESYPPYMRLHAFLVVCAEVMMLLAHQDKLFSEHGEIESWKQLYDDNHEFENAA